MCQILGRINKVMLDHVSKGSRRHTCLKGRCRSGTDLPFKPTFTVILDKYCLETLVLFECKFARKKAKLLFVRGYKKINYLMRKKKLRGAEGGNLLLLKKQSYLHQARSSKEMQQVRGTMECLLFEHLSKSTVYECMG